MSEFREFNQIDLSFLPISLDEIPFDIKENPQLYVSELKKSFRKSLGKYNLENPRRLPIELNSNELISEMSLEQKVAQLFIFGFEGTSLTENERTYFADTSPGWVILMWKNVSSWLDALIGELQASQNTLPLFVSIDQEWGLVKRLEENLPGQSEVVLSDICDVYTARSKLLKDLGVTMNFGIVADVTNNKDSFIFSRVFQGDVEAKISAAVSCTDTTLSTLKHFPWHWWTTLDTHKGVARINLAKSEREEADLQAFESWILSWADQIMMWHLQADFIDPWLPATLSRPTNDFLRNMWFTWVVVTDDMWMIKDHGDWKVQLEQALTAGNDLILYVDGTQRKEILSHAISYVKQWGISLEDLDQRLLRIISKKQKIISLDDFVPLSLIKE